MKEPDKCTEWRWVQARALLGSQVSADAPGSGPLCRNPSSCLCNSLWTAPTHRPQSHEHARLVTLHSPPGRRSGVTDSSPATGGGGDGRGAGFGVGSRTRSAAATLRVSAATVFSRLAASSTVLR